MQINKDWSIESNDLNITVLRSRITAKGEECQTPVMYYSPTRKGLAEAYIFLVEQEAFGHGLSQIEKIIARMDVIANIIYKMLDLPETRTTLPQIPPKPLELMPRHEKAVTSIFRPLRRGRPKKVVA